MNIKWQMLHRCRSSTAKAYLLSTANRQSSSCHACCLWDCQSYPEVQRWVNHGLPCGCANRCPRASQSGNLTLSNAPCFILRWRTPSTGCILGFLISPMMVRRTAFSPPVQKTFLANSLPSLNILYLKFILQPQQTPLELVEFYYCFHSLKLSLHAKPFVQVYQGLDFP